jgi:ribosomal protein S18 acetylase RimI-like enzyme
MIDANIRIRKAVAGDAGGMVAVMERITEERIHSAIDRPWTVDEQRRYLESLSSREACHIALARSGAIVGYQSLDLYAPLLPSMAHVGQLGTFLAPDWRRRGIGRALFQATTTFARSCGYRKFVIQVRASNDAARSFYQGLGFIECGRFARQVTIDGLEDDEILMEHFLSEAEFVRSSRPEAV